MHNSQPTFPFKRPLFIVIEGLDGSGTTTQSQLLCESLQQKGQPTLFTYEPSSGPVGVLIRQMLAMRVVTPAGNGQFEAINRETLALLFAADRLDHIASEIEPALASGRIVVSDRYYYSSLAYQGDLGHGTETDFEWVRQLNSRARTPDITFFMEASAELCLSRLGQRGRRDIYETRATIERLEKRYDEVMTIYERSGQNIVRIDANQSIQDIKTIIFDSVIKTAYQLSHP